MKLHCILVCVFAFTIFCSLGAQQFFQQHNQVRILIIGAHPDDPDNCGGTALKWISAGYKVRMMSATNGCAGHQSMGGGELARRRAEEARKAGQVIGAEYVVLDNPDGELMPTLENRRQFIQILREYKPDLIISPRPNDYHPDHRYTAILIQDAAYMVTVPNIVPQTPHLEKNPVIMYARDRFQKPNPFNPSVVIDITDVIEKKIDMLDCHESQMYEWLPFNRGTLSQVPADKINRRRWLGETWKPNWAKIADEYRTKAVELYGKERAEKIKYAEAFELCEYGAPLDKENLAILFPF